MSLLYVPLPKPQTVRLMADGDPVPILGQTLVSDMYHLGEFLCDGICYGSVERFKLGEFLREAPLFCTHTILGKY